MDDDRVLMRKEPFLYLLAFGMDSCFALVGLCVPLLAMEVGATYDDLGALRAVGAAVYSASCFAAGRLADRMGYRLFMTGSALLVAVVLLAYLRVDRVWPLFVLAGAGGILLSGFWPSLQAWLGRGKDRRQLLPAVGRFNVAWSLGFLIGPALGGMLYGLGSRRVFALAAALAGLVFLALLAVRVREEEGDGESAGAPSLEAARRFLPVAWVANFATFYAAGTVRALFPKLATDLGLEAAPLGWLMALIGLGQVAGFLAVSRTDRWQFRLAPVIVLQVLALLGLVGLAATDSWIVFGGGLLVQGWLIGMTFSASMFYSLHAEGPGGRRTGIHEGIVGSGVFVGPLLGGLVAEHVGPRSPYVLAAVVLGAAALVEVALVRRHGASAALASHATVHTLRPPRSGQEETP